MAQDLGSAILAGIQGAQAMGQQRFRNRLAQDELEQNERRLGIMDRQATVAEAENKRLGDEANRLNLIRQSDQFIQAASAGDFLSSDMLSIDGEKLRRGIESGNRTAIQFGLDLVNKSGELPEGSRAEAIQPLPDGGYAITVRNKDGSQGVVTRDGSSNPDSEVVSFDAGALANLGNLYYQTSVVSNSSLISPTIYRTRANQIDADAKRNETLDLIQRKNRVLNAMPPGGARRAAASALASASSPAEENELLNRFESDLSNAGAPPQRNNAPAAAPTRPAATPAASSATASAPPTSSLTERAYRGIKADPSAAQAVGNGFDKRELTDVFAYALRQGDEDMASKIEPFLKNRHGVTDAQIGGIRRQMATTRRETGESTVLPDAIARTAKKSADVAATAAEEAYTRAGFGERAARERAEREAGQLASIRKDASPATTQTGKAATIRVTDPTVSSEIRGVTRAVSGRPAAAVDRDINAGKIRVTPATAAAVSANLREQGINNVEGLLRLNDRDRALARAVILATEPDANIRKQMSEEISNIFETGSVSLTRQELETQNIQREQNRLVGERNQIDRATLNVRMAEVRRDLFKTAAEDQRKVVELGAKFIEAANKIYFGADGSEMNLNAATAARFTNSIMGPYMYRALRAPTKAEGQAALTAMSPAISTTVAAMAAEEKGGFTETLVSFFRADAVDTVSSTDFDLARVRVEKKNGRPTRFYYTDERGAPVDEAVDAKDLQNLNGQVYKIVLDAAEYNSRGR